MIDFGSTGRALVDALDEAALIVDRNLVRLANAEARALLGSAIEGRDVRLAIRHPQALQHILAGADSEVEVSGLVEPGRSWKLAVRGLGRGAVLVRMIDRSGAVSAEKMRVDFVANASHELRTPLATIIGYAETIADEAELDTELRSRFGSTIRGEAQRMLRIIEDLMSLSRIEADRFVPPAEVVDVGELVHTAVDHIRQASSASGCEFVVEVPPGLPSIRGDGPQLAQLLDNLLANAVRYGCEGGSSRVEVSAVSTAGFVSLTVADHGPGIARDHLPRITERFYRVDPARSRQSGGTGLGLAIVKHIVERHRGTLDIKSVVGRGTSVTVRLPVSGPGRRASGQARP